MITQKARRLKSWLQNRLARVNRNALIVMGKEKSGTTAIAALLAARCRQSVTLDIPPLWGEAETQIRDGTLALEEFVKRHAVYFSRQIVKEPCLTFMSAQVVASFPVRRHVMVVRDPRDNIRSILNRVGIAGNLDQIDSESLRRVPQGWETVMDPIWNRCSPEAHYIDVQAHRWVEATKCLSTGDAPRPVVIRYEDFVEAKRKAIDRLASDCGLEASVDIASLLDRQFQPKGNRDINWDEFFGAKNLSRILDICGVNMRALDYRLGDAPST